MSESEDSQQTPASPPEPQEDKKPSTQETGRQLATRTKSELVAFRTYPDAGWLGGVCAGLAYRFGVATWVVRLAWVLVILFTGVGILPYLLLWFFVPNAATPRDYVERTGDEED